MNIYTARGDITAVVNSSGAIVNTYTYTPWGKMGSVSEQVENPFRYASYRYDTETGLYYLQNRYYNPDLMRFITRDAIRDQVADPSTSNYYHYADGNPIMKIDPDGNAWWWVLYFIYIWGPAYITPATVVYFRYQRQINGAIRMVVGGVRTVYRTVYGWVRRAVYRRVWRIYHYAHRC